MCHTCLLTAFEQDQNRTQFHPDPAEVCFSQTCINQNHALTYFLPWRSVYSYEGLIVEKRMNSYTHVCC